MADTKPLLANHTYDVMKNAVILTLPAMATLYFAIAKIWSLPYADDIVATITALSTFFGIILRVSSKRYDANEAQFGGTIDVIQKPEGGQKVLFAFKDDEVAENLDKRDEITFKIVRS